jgi:hypothetical protein
MKLLELIRTIIISFSPVYSLLMLYFAVVSSKLEYASVGWNSVMITDSSEPERILRQIAALFYSRCTQDVKCYYDNLLESIFDDTA